MRSHLKQGAYALVALLTMTVALAFLGPGSAQAADDYPYRADTSNAVDPWTFTKRQCVSFAAWRLAQRGQAATVRYWGNARDWDNRASAKGVRVTRTPRVGAVAHWNAGERSDTFSATSRQPTGWMRAGSYGHVAVVKAVHRDGSVTVEQYNMGNDVRRYSTKRLKAPRFLWVGLR